MGFLKKIIKTAIDFDPITVAVKVHDEITDVVNEKLEENNKVYKQKLKEKLKEEERCLMIFGSKGSGKTTLWNQLRGGAANAVDDVEIGKTGGFEITNGDISVKFITVIDYEGSHSNVAQASKDLEERLKGEYENYKKGNKEILKLSDLVSEFNLEMECALSRKNCILFLIDLMTIEEKKTEILLRLRRISDSIMKVQREDGLSRLNGEEEKYVFDDCMLLLTNVKEFRAKYPMEDIREVYQRVIGNSIDPQRVCLKFSSVMAVDVSDKKHVEKIKEKLLEFFWSDNSI